MSFRAISLLVLSILISLAVMAFNVVMLAYMPHEEEVADAYSEEYGYEESTIESLEQEELEDIDYIYLDEQIFSSDNMKKLYHAISTFETNIVLDVESEEAFIEMMEEMYLFMDDTIYTFAYKELWYTVENGVCDIEISYYDEYVEQLKESEIIAKQIAANIFTDDMSDLDKIKAAYDYIVLNTEYDEPAQIAMEKKDILDEPVEANCPYAVLKKNIAICQGYSLAFNMLLNEAGIETRSVSSEELEHAWSMVLLDGTWYHCDPTYDDPVPNSEGGVTYEFFMKNDEYMDSIESGRLVDTSPKADGISYYYDIYAKEGFVLDGDEYLYNLKDDVLFRYPYVYGQPDFEDGEEIIDDVSSWCDIEEEYYLLYTRKSNGDIYMIDFDGHHRSRLVKTDDVMVVGCESTEDEITIWCVNELQDEPFSFVADR